MALKAGLIPINNMLTQYSTFYEVLMSSALALIILALFLQIRARASFSWARAVGIATAILATLAYPIFRSAQ